MTQKRHDIRNVLRLNGHAALFSEELTPDATMAPEPSTTLELLQARNADLIIILLEDSPGALAELHDFAGRRDIIDRCFVLAPNRYRHGYSGTGLIQALDRGHGAVYWYDDFEVAACNVLTAAVERAEARRHIEMWHRGRA